MDSLRLDTLGGHVVAWHNGHRLARRITVVHVSSLGYVVLPFASAQASTAAALPPAAAQTPESGTPTPAPAAQGLAPAVAVAMAPGTDGVEAPSDEPIEVLIDAPDLDLRTVTGAPSDDPGAQSLAEAAALAEPDRPAEAPLDIVFDAPTTEPTAGAGADAGADAGAVVDVDVDVDSEAGTAAAPDSPPPEAQTASDPTAATNPEAAAGPTAGATEVATLRERAMARARQMAQEAAAKAPPPDRAPADPAPPSPAPPAVAALAADMLAAPPAAAPEQNPAAPANAPLAAAPPAAAATASPANDLRPIFSEDFIPPHKLADVAAFALLHGAVYASPGKDGLVRVVKPDPALAVPVVEQRWLLTAQIDIGGQRTRVLVGAGSNPAVMGLPLSQLPRLALLGGPPLAVVAAAGLWWLWPVAPKAPKAPQVPMAATHAASAASAASAAAPIAAAASAAALAAAASAVQASASAPADVEPTLGRVELPSLGSIVDERRRTAAAAAETRAASAATAAIEQAKKSVPPPPVVGPAFAVSTRLLRTRTESEQLADAMRELLAGSGPPGLQVQALRSGEDWRVVVWPFTKQAQAEQARALLASRGMKVAVIDF